MELCSREKLIAEEKFLGATSCSTHASEIAATLSIELGYDPATKGRPEVRRIFDKAIVLVWVCLNAYGNIIVAERYNRNAGTKYESGGRVRLRRTN